VEILLHWFKGNRVNPENKGFKVILELELLLEVLLDKYF
jgi:hypothetical protein